MTHDGTHPQTYDPADALRIAKDRTRRLGKLPHKANPLTLRLARYIDAKALPPVPSKWNNDHVVSTWPMFGNDRFGDCTFAAKGHEIQLWTAAAGHMFTVTDEDILTAYSAVTGFDRNRPSTDQGAAILDTLNYFRHTGIAGHKIGAFAEIDPSHHPMMKDGIYLFGCVELGVALPEAAQHMGTHWTRPAGRLIGSKAPDSWGGHDVPIVDFDRYGAVAVSWGELIHISWGFLDAYCDEAWALMSSDFVNGTGHTPEGFDVATLQADLAAIGKPA